MKLDLILENIRNKYTLGLLEESTVSGLDEKTVLQGKIMINEATQSLRGLLIEEGVMAGVKNVLANDFASIIEESWKGNGLDKSKPISKIARPMLAHELFTARKDSILPEKHVTPLLVNAQRDAKEALANHRSKLRFRKNNPDIIVPGNIANNPKKALLVDKSGNIVK